MKDNFINTVINVIYRKKVQDNQGRNQIPK
jgi:hypothetical protein